MSVTSVQIADRERYLNQIEKLVHSHTLRKAESLCKLLRYLADHALSEPGISLKEYQIATEVFGRPEDFDPQADSAIRVQAGRLRLKLLDYYSHEGSGDSVVVEVPNGSYALSFHDRELPAPRVVPAPLNLQSPIAPPMPRKSARRWLVVVVTLSAVLAAALTALAILLVALNSARTEKKRALTASSALREFWSPFASGPDAPWVIFSNAAFVGRPETGMRYLDPTRDSRDLILDHYTGVGENLSLLDLPGTQEFVFNRRTSNPHKGELGILNVHPDPGQPPIFYPSNSSHPLAEDYAIVALVHGLNPARHVMILAGTTTIGTQAAVEYVCAQDSVEELIRSLALHRSEIKPFEALLRVKVSRGVPVGIQLVAVRHRK